MDMNISDIKVIEGEENSRNGPNLSRIFKQSNKMSSLNVFGSGTLSSLQSSGQFSSFDKIQSHSIKRILSNQN